jgi:hypothetical protein
MGTLSSRAVALLAACAMLGAMAAACSDLLGITTFTPAGEEGGSSSGSDAGEIIAFGGYATAADPDASLQALSPSLTWAQSAGDLIVLLINYDPNLGLVQISDVSGNAYTEFGPPVTNAAYHEAMYYCLNAKAAAAGANAVTVSLNAPARAGYFSVAVFGFAAPRHTWAQDRYVNNSQTDASSVTTGVVTTSFPNEVLVSGTGVDRHATEGSGSPWVTGPMDPLGDLQEYLIVSSIQTDIAATYTQSPPPANAVSQLGTFAAKP